MKSIKLAKAKADANKILADSQREIKLLDGESLSERTDQRVLHQEQKQQLNIESIVYKAADILKDEESVEPEPVDEDWISQFIDICKNVSNHTMQDIWAKILAGEVKKPKSFSLRTLQMLRTLDQKDAECFVKLSNFVIQDSDGDKIPFIIYDAAIKSQIDYRYNLSDPISYLEYLSLLELGLISSAVSDFLVNGKNDLNHIKLENGDIQKNFIFGNVFKVRLTIKASAHEFRLINIVTLTKMGCELLKLINPELQKKDEISKYIDDFHSFFFTTRSKNLVSIDKEEISYPKSSGD